jgi:hypothetical protein
MQTIDNNTKKKHAHIYKLPPKFIGSHHSNSLGPEATTQTHWNTYIKYINLSKHAKANSYDPSHMSLSLSPSTQNTHTHIDAHMYIRIKVTNYLKI